MVAVATNAGYQPLAVFIIRDETAETITHVPEWLKCNGANPDTLVMDDSAAYQPSVKVFPGTHTKKICTSRKYQNDRFFRPMVLSAIFVFGVHCSKV